MNGPKRTVPLADTRGLSCQFVVQKSGQHPSRILEKADTPVTGFALELTLETDASVAYLFIYFGLSWMAALSVNLRTDKLSPLAITIVSGLAVYLDATKIYPQPIHGLSYLNRFCIASCLVLLLPFVGLIISSKKR